MPELRFTRNRLTCNRGARSPVADFLTAPDDGIYVIGWRAESKVVEMKAGERFDLSFDGADGSGDELLEASDD